MKRIGAEERSRMSRPLHLLCSLELTLTFGEKTPICGFRSARFTKAMLHIDLLVLVSGKGGIQALQDARHFCGSAVIACDSQHTWMFICGEQERRKLPLRRIPQ